MPKLTQNTDTHTNTHTNARTHLLRGPVTQLRPGRRLSGRLLRLELLRNLLHREKLCPCQISPDPMCWSLFNRISNHFVYGAKKLCVEYRSYSFPHTG